MLHFPPPSDFLSGKKSLPFSVVVVVALILLVKVSAFAEWRFNSNKGSNNENSMVAAAALNWRNPISGFDPGSEICFCWTKGRGARPTKAALCLTVYIIQDQEHEVKWENFWMSLNTAIFSFIFLKLYVDFN